MVVAKVDFPFRQQHPIGYNTANICRFQGDPGARNIGSRWREYADKSGPGIGCSTDDLNRFRSVIDLTDGQFIGIGVPRSLNNTANDKPLQVLGPIMNFINLKADHSQALDDVLQGRRGVQMFFEPLKGKLHGLQPPDHGRDLQGPEPVMAEPPEVGFIKRA